jgi:hypothetical protein
MAEGAVPEAGAVREIIETAAGQQHHGIEPFGPMAVLPGRDHDVHRECGDSSAEAAVGTDHGAVERRARR